MKYITALLCTVAMATAAWAGSHGNGADQRNGYHRAAETSYAFCYGGNQHTEYFSRVFALTGMNDGGVAFGHYLDQMGYRNDGGLCRSAPTESGAIAYKSEIEEQFRSATYHHRKIVQTAWSGL